MVKVNISQLNSPGFPYGLFVDDPGSSLFFCLGYSIIKMTARTKGFKEIHCPYLQACRKVLGECSQAYTAQSSILSGFIQLIEWIAQVEDIKVVWGYVENFENPEYLQQVIETGKCVFYYLLKDEEADVVFNTEPFKVFGKLCLCFKCYVRVWWNGGDWLYKGTGQESIFNLYYGDSGFVWMIGENHTTLEHDLSSNLKLAQEHFLYTEFIIPTENSQQYKTSVILGHPKLIKLVEVMAETIAKHKIYSQTLQDLLTNAINENKSLSQLDQIIKIQELTPPFCQLHSSSDFIPLFCKNQHCKNCVFEKIKIEFRKDNFKIFCSCNVQIPPKMVKEIKALEGYQEYSSRFRSK